MLVVVFCSCVCRLWWFARSIRIFMMCRLVGGIDILVISFLGVEMYV